MHSFGVVAYRSLPISDLPTVDYPTINVSASLAGASPETMAAAVATPLEKQFSTIAGIDNMTSSSTLGSVNITLQANGQLRDAAGFRQLSVVYRDGAAVRLDMLGKVLDDIDNNKSASLVQSVLARSCSPSSVNPARTPLRSPKRCRRRSTR